MTGKGRTAGLALSGSAEQLFAGLGGSEGSRSGGWQGGKALVVAFLLMGSPMGQVTGHPQDQGWVGLLLGGKVTGCDFPLQDRDLLSPCCQHEVRNSTPMG